MKEEDLPFVIHIERISFTNPWTEMTFKGEIFNDSISSPLVIVHKPENKVIGHIIFWCIKEEAQINNIAIHPNYRRLGIATAVMQQVLQEVQKKGVRFVSLEVRPSNLAALSLYSRLNFKFLGIRKDYYHSPKEHAFVMGRWLDQ